MSYILDALRKSESERQQGRIPDLGQQVQLIHRPRKRGIPAGVWIAFALCLNALILGAIFWPDLPWYAGRVANGDVRVTGNTAAQVSADPVVTDPVKQPVINSKPSEVSASAIGSLADDTEPAAEMAPEAAGGGESAGQDRPTLIVPSPNRDVEPAVVTEQTGSDTASSERIPHLVEMPMSFQRRVPTLIFNSHVYASDPAARRVIINDHYMRTGDTFSGIRVDRITEDGVELSMDGQRFRVGVLRDWISPR